jgi:hypothetical protein
MAIRDEYVVEALTYRSEAMEAVGAKRRELLLLALISAQLASAHALDARIVPVPQRSPAPSAQRSQHKAS